MLTVRLENGRTIHLDSYYVWKTYGGLLEGKPNKTINETVLRDATSVHKRWWPNVPFLMLDSQIDIERELPGVSVAALFLSYTPAKDSDAHGSHLVVCCFQAASCPILDERNETYLKKLDWEKLAADFEW
jgi:hypothetical protein